MDYTFKDFIELYQTLNNSEWITVFEEKPTKNYENNIFTFCAMFKATQEELKEYLLKYYCDYKLSFLLHSWPIVIR